MNRTDQSKKLSQREREVKIYRAPFILYSLAWSYVHLIFHFRPPWVLLVNIYQSVAGASNFEICHGWWNAWLFACKGFDFASKLKHICFPRIFDFSLVCQKYSVFFIEFRESNLSLLAWFICRSLVKYQWPVQHIKLWNLLVLLLKV